MQDSFTTLSAEGTGLEEVARRELSAGLAPEDVSVDEEGRITVADPQMARRLSAITASGPTPRDTNNGCTVTNTVAGCGGKTE